MWLSRRRQRQSSPEPSQMQMQLTRLRQSSLQIWVTRFVLLSTESWVWFSLHLWLMIFRLIIEITLLQLRIVQITCFVWSTISLISVSLKLVSTRLRKKYVISRALLKRQLQLTFLQQMERIYHLIYHLVTTCLSLSVQMDSVSSRYLTVCFQMLSSLLPMVE